MTIKSEVQEVCNLMSELDEIVQAEHTDWKTKYHLVFTAHVERIFPRLNALGLRVSWDDPDSSYEDDTQAYHQGMMELYNQLQSLIDKPEDKTNT